MACSLRGIEQEVRLVPGTRAGVAYRVHQATEKFMCRFGVNEAYGDRLFGGDLVVSGIDSAGSTRIAERRSSAFFMGTLFLPQLSSQQGQPHPLILAFVEAATQFGAARRGRV